MRWRGAQANDSDGKHEDDQGQALADLLASQFEVELDRFNRYQTRLSQFQTSATFSVTVLGVAAAAGRRAAGSSGIPLSAWWFLLVAAVFLVLSLVISIIFTGRAGVAALTAEQLAKWYPGQWSSSNEEVRKWAAEFTLKAIGAQEDTNKKMRRAWLAATAFQLVGLFCALVAVLILLYP